MQLDTPFNIQQKVKMVELGICGTVKSIWIDSKGVSYQIRYFWNGEGKEAYFFEDELRCV